ncbi:hypothetical protein QUB75_11025 [Microcoleus sp. K1-B6]|uniref:hypothetical protein n=1 Tax=unclassified Microcoleus TaxID=2642155 RepID=UPI002FD2E7C8
MLFFIELINKSDEVLSTEKPLVYKTHQLFLEAAANCDRALQEMDEARPLTDEEHEAAGWIFDRSTN